ncbi:PH domain-containing protein [Saccharopolyspora rosea]|uniref:PH domain-containing protein n=1 Tax=Saccharopolyspora rosea TaxID=524884 RepID=A0ABW3FWA1_9PSEU|nr:PH domain-containing protein [Saccharopolyspora rosea]
MSETPHEPEQPEAADAARPAADAEQAAETPRLPESLTFRITPVALLAVLAVVVCATPVAATAGGPALLLYLVPLGLLVWILRTRTTVSPERVTVRTMFGGTRFTWDDVRALRLDEKRWIRAVLASGNEVALSAVRVRDLPRLSAMSGGRLPDPNAQE